MIDYLGNSSFQHHQTPSTGVLLVNLGTPQAPTARALRPYLREFLSDPRVIEKPRLLWWFILNLFILPRRPKRSAELYKKVWTKEGSPLYSHSKKQAELLQQRMSETCGSPVHVELAMRYGSPSVHGALNLLREKGVTKLLVIPLYPQYSATTTGSTFDAVAEALKQWRWVPELRFINHYHDDPGYIAALAESVEELWDREGEPEKLLMSFHGIPKRYFQGGDPYFCHCQKTGRLLAERLRLEKDRYEVSFQSLFGKEEWIRPYTDETLKNWGKTGIKKVDVICPGFAADCLETLEEIEGENRHYFLEAGGTQYRYIPALNSRPDFMDALTNIVTRNLFDWTTPKTSWDAALAHSVGEQREARFRKVGNQ